MPVYEFVCQVCGARTERLVRARSTIEVPQCPQGGDNRQHVMMRVMSAFAQHKTEGDKLADAEATYGAEVEAAMGAGPDIGRLARRYERLSHDLPPGSAPVEEV